MGQLALPVPAAAGYTVFLPVGHEHGARPALPKGPGFQFSLFPANLVVLEWLSTLYGMA